VEIKGMFDEINRVVSIEPKMTVEPDNLAAYADRDHFSRILINLIENAAKYAPDSPVELYAWQKNQRALVAVVDHGPGIPEHSRESIFERFTQLDQSDTRSRGGTGLGLSIVKSLVEVMHGAVRVEATEGGGATFVLDLPAAASIPVDV
jgi:signal transduction histidine kinase